MVTSGHIVRSVFTLSIAQLLTLAASAAVTIMLPRYLGDAGLGKLVSAMALTQLCGLLADAGATTYLVKEVAREPGRAGVVTSNLIAMRVPLTLLAGGMAVGVAHVAGYDTLTKSIVYVLSFGIFVNAVASIVSSALQGLHQIKVLAVTSAMTKIGFAVAVGALLLLGGGPLEVAIGPIVVSMLVLVIAVAALVRQAPLVPALDWRAWRPLFLGGLPFFVWQAAVLVYGQIDTVLLSFLTHDVVVGWYYAAYRIVMIPVFIPTVLVTVIFPALSAATKDPAAYNAIARRAVHVVSLVSIPMALGIMLLPDKIIGVFGYPESFGNSVVPLILLAPHLPLAAIDVMIGTILNTQDRQRQWAMTGVAAAILNPLVNFAAIPFAQATFGNGAIGAAAVTTFTEIFMMVVGLRLLSGGVLDRGVFLGAVKCLVAGLLMSAAVWLTREYPIVVPVGLGALVYAGACLTLGAISLGDLRQVQLHLLRREPAAQASSLPS